MFEPTVINVICPQCRKTWMAAPLGPNQNYFCYCCEFTLTENEARQQAWKGSGSIYYGE